MASNSALASTALLLMLFSLVSSHNVPCPPSPSKPTPKPKTCPCNILKFGVCTDVLGMIGINLGEAPSTPCCGLLTSLTELDAAVCLCSALKADVLGVISDIPVRLSLLMNCCGKKAPAGFQCA